MARVNNLTNFLTDVATAIKTKKSSSTNIPAANFDTEILALPSQGTYQTKQVNITTNGNYAIQPDTNYDAIEEVALTVNVAGDSYQTKSLTITTNGDYTVIPDANYDALDKVNITVDIEGGSEDLAAELNAQDSKIAALEAALDRKMTGGSSQFNAFVQPTEPTVKKGLWIERANATIKHFYGDDNIYFADEWITDRYADIPYPFMGGAVGINGDIYLFGSSNASYYRYAYKYNISTNTYTRLTDIPYDYRDGSTVAIGTDIYLFGGRAGNSAYKYNTLTDTYTQLTDVPYTMVFSGIVAIGTDIYLFGSGNGSASQYAYKYNTLTDAYTNLKNVPVSYFDGATVAVGTDVYLFDGSGSYGTYVYRYDTLTNTYTRLTNRTVSSSSKVMGAVVIGTDIYLFGGGDTPNQFAIYDTLTDTYTTQPNLPISSTYFVAIYMSDNIYLLSAGSNAKIQCLPLVTKSYKKYSLVVAQGIYYNRTNLTELFTLANAETPVLNGIVDAWYVNGDGEIETNLPTYYGDGTQWIKIKN